MKRALLITICIVLWIGSVEAQSKPNNPNLPKAGSLTDAEADAILDRILDEKEREEQQEIVSKLQVMKASCGVNITLNEFLRETKVEWRFIGRSQAERYFYNTIRLSCTYEGALRFWAKMIPDSTKPSRKAISFTLQQLEVKCGSDQIRTLSHIDYDKNGDVIKSLSINDRWEDIVPSSMGETMLNRVCHK